MIGSDTAAAYGIAYPSRVPTPAPSRITLRDGSRRLSQAIAEGDGISVLVEVADAVAAQAAQDQGAEGLVVRGPAANDS